MSLAIEAVISKDISKYCLQTQGMGLDQICSVKVNICRVQMDRFLFGIFIRKNSGSSNALF